MMVDLSKSEQQCVALVGAVPAAWFVMTKEHSIGMTLWAVFFSMQPVAAL